MEQTGKIAAALFAAIGGFLAVSLWGPFKSGRFDYASAPLEQKQKYLEAKARNFSRGFRLTSGGASEITQTYADAENDLVSISVQLKGAETGYVPADQLETFRKLMLKTACSLTERTLLTETDFNLRIRFFKPGGGKLMIVEANGETCAPYLAQERSA